MLESAVRWVTETIFQLGYPGILALMALESSFVPFPSEVVLPPAGYLAAQGRMNPFLAFAAGLGGSLVGAFFNYYVALALGRPLLHRYARFVLVKETALNRAEEFFRRHGEISTFVGRLVPLIRQLISVPAGLARMAPARFALYTSLGAGIWCAILTAVGWYVGRNATIVVTLDSLIGSPEVRLYTTRVTFVLIPVLVVVVGVYVIRYRRAPHAAQSLDDGPEIG